MLESLYAARLADVRWPSAWRIDLLCSCWWVPVPPVSGGDSDEDAVRPRWGLRDSGQDEHRKPTWASTGRASDGGNEVERIPAVAGGNSSSRLDWARILSVRKMEVAHSDKCGVDGCILEMLENSIRYTIFVH